jgi:hypothetical protein
MRIGKEAPAIVVEPLEEPAEVPAQEPEPETSPGPQEDPIAPGPA